MGLLEENASNQSRRYYSTILLIDLYISPALQGYLVFGFLTILFEKAQLGDRTYRDLEIPPTGTLELMRHSKPVRLGNRPYRPR